jgi:DNA-binding NarL/FixJ family response regulator
MTLITEPSDLMVQRLPKASDLESTLTRLVDLDPNLADLTLGELLSMYAAGHERRSQGQASPVRPPDDAELLQMHSTLSSREMDVVRLLTEGLSNREIGMRLTLSDKTVKNHISHILAKLHLSARTQVAIMALRAGLA